MWTDRLLHMPGGNTHECTGGKLLSFTQGQVLKRNLGPGSLPVTAGRTIFTKGLLGKLAGIFTITITTNDHHQFFSIDSRDKHPVEFVHVIEKISYYHKDIRSADSAYMCIGPALADFERGRPRGRGAH